MIQNSEESMEINGFVLVSDYDRRGNIVELMIETDYFDKYIIAPDDMGRQLWTSLNRKMRLNGVVTGENLRGRKVFRVESYELLDAERHPE